MGEYKDTKEERGQTPEMDNEVAWWGVKYSGGNSDSFWHLKEHPEMRKRELDTWTFRRGCCPRRLHATACHFLSTSTSPSQNSLKIQVWSLLREPHMGRREEEVVVQ
uniref:Uncharacterized protein n=1 Tax=Knipowitschia caucasica TaxID=637954 RepID=A0AAV2KK69_KNICA